MCRKDLRPSFIPLPFARALLRPKGAWSSERRKNDIKEAFQAFESYFSRFLSVVLIEWPRDYGYLIYRESETVVKKKLRAMNSAIYVLMKQFIIAINISKYGVLTSFLYSSFVM